MTVRQSTHRLKRSGSRVLDGFTTEKVVFKFSSSELMVLESCEYRGMSDAPKARYSLAPGTDVRWTWPADAEQFVDELCSRGCSGTRVLSLAVGGRAIGELEWGRPSGGYESGRAIAATIERCRDAGLRVTVVGMPAAYATPMVASGSSRKRSLEEQTTETTSTRFISTKPTPVVAARLKALRPTPIRLPRPGVLATSGAAPS